MMLSTDDLYNFTDDVVTTAFVSEITQVENGDNIHADVATK